MQCLRNRQKRWNELKKDPRHFYYFRTALSIYLRPDNPYDTPSLDGGPIKMYPTTTSSNVMRFSSLGIPIGRIGFLLWPSSKRKLFKCFVPLVGVTRRRQEKCGGICRMNTRTNMMVPQYRTWTNGPFTTVLPMLRYKPTTMTVECFVA